MHTILGIKKGNTCDYNTPLTFSIHQPVVQKKMKEYPHILNAIFEGLYRKDVDFSINVFLCGASTSKRETIRDMLNTALKADAKFNAVYPEYIFASIMKKKGYNLLELEDDLARQVDLIIIPLEGIGTYCELGAFAVNELLLPKIILINEITYKKSKSFINLGPVDLVYKNNSKNVIYYDKGKEKDIINEVMKRARMKRHEKTTSYALDNLFNLSRLILYMIAVFQPISKDSINILLTELNKGKVNQKYIDSAIQVLTQKNRIEQDIDESTLNKSLALSKEGHFYFYEELIVKLNVKTKFTCLRSEIINDRYKPKKKNLSKEKKLLV